MPAKQGCARTHALVQLIRPDGSSQGCADVRESAQLITHAQKSRVCTDAETHREAVWRHFLICVRLVVLLFSQVAFLVSIYLIRTGLMNWQACQMR
eukprot:6202954-Pleurochrysis_carterae.AAC.2